MIQQLVAAQLQCNKRSFSDQPKVTVLPLAQPSGAGGLAWEGNEALEGRGWERRSSRGAGFASSCPPGLGFLGRVQRITPTPPPTPMSQPWPLGADPQSRDARQQRFAHFTELAIISVQEIVDFAKQVPGFLQLGREDQIALLKASTIEVTAGPPILSPAPPSCLQDKPWDKQDPPLVLAFVGMYLMEECQNTKQGHQRFSRARGRKETG